ncbi:MAG: DUF3299 domain-containing protein [Thermodesulfobacteriota bacterium]
MIAFTAGGGGLWPVRAFAQGEPARKTEGNGVVIKKEEGPAGHETIGIEEKSIDTKKHKLGLLTFSILSAWVFNPNAPSAPPPEIREWDGRKVQITGFMYPLQEGKEIRYFCLLRTTQTCCYGPRPQFNQYVFVEMNSPTLFRRLSPVTCAGLFKVDPEPEDGFIYRMEGTACENVKPRE